MGNWLYKAADLWEQGRPHAQDARRRAAAGATSALEWSGERLTKVPAVERVVASKQFVQRAQTTYDDAREDLHEAMQRCEVALDGLGRLELDVLDHELRQFTSAFDQVKRIEVSPPRAAGDHIVQAAPQWSMDEADLKAVDMLQDAVRSGSVGAAVGGASWASAVALASASTDTALSSLSGAAATSATLAWFGGGSAAAGGLGVAGGVAVLGSLVATPALLAGGYLFHRRTMKIHEDAQTTVAEAERQASEMRVQQARLHLAVDRVRQLERVLRRVSSRLGEEVRWLQGLVNREPDYPSMPPADQQRLHAAVALAQTAKAIVDVPIFDDEGQLTSESALVVTDAEAVLT